MPTVMLYGLSGAGIPLTLPYADVVGPCCLARNFPPLFAYAVACRESIVGQLNGKWNAETVVSNDGGHGLFQLTSSWPDPGWDRAGENTGYALDHFLIPAVQYWHGLERYSGDDLIRLVAATFNAGLGAAIKGHAEGNVDAYTTDDYAAGVLAYYHSILDTGHP